MTDQEYEAMYANCLKRMDEYIKTQRTEEQIRSAKHQKHNVVINKGHIKYCIDKGEKVVQCDICGALATTNYTKPTPQRMIDQNLCFHCLLWQDRVNENDPKRLIIEGGMYSDGGDQPSNHSNTLGFGGRRFKIERDGLVWSTNNLWFAGVVPEEWREKLPDNAKFLKQD